MTDGSTERNSGLPSRRRGRPLDVAIVGMACRFPGARDLAAFWENILAGRDSTGDVPSSRWDSAVFFDPDATANDRVYCRRGGYLDEPIEFDPTRYGIMPVAVEGGEPEQFLVLDAARAALDDAGLPDGPPSNVRVDVVIGKGNYFNRGNLTRLQHGRIVAQTLALLKSLHPDWTDGELEAVRVNLKASLPPFEAGTIPGQLTNATAGRVAERLNLSGSSYVVDAASASSLVALDLGTQALVHRRADIAIVGGVYLQPDVDFPMVFCRLGALSRRGQARPFSKSADGTLPGEGVGVVVLKRLADATRDGDRVYAVVQGVGLASDGRGVGLAAPSAKGHARAIRAAYRASGIDPTTVAFVEGHGLGVPASDRAELRALLKTFPRPRHGARVLGALTALIGHAMPAAGIAGLIKSALALHHRLLPPTPHADEPHPWIARSDQFALNPVTRPWIHGDESHPRRAGVNAFGFAGINAHAVLEEHAPSADGMTPGAMTRWDSEAVLLGAADRAGWVALAGALLDWLDSGRNAAVALKDLASTLNIGQAPFPFRVGFVASSTTDLRAKLKAAIEKVGAPDCKAIRDARGTYFWSEPLGGSGKLAFLYPGEGSQYPGMLADLCPHFPALRTRLDVADRIAIERGHDHLPSSLLFDPARQADAGLFAIGSAVNVVLSTQWALHHLLIELGLRPDAMVGHSSGEIIALAAAGVVGMDRDFEERLGDLGSVFEGLENQGVVPTALLVAVAAPREKVEAVCRETGGSVLVAMDNCPHQVVIAGAPEHVGPVVIRLRGLGLICEELPFHRAYHTPRFAEALAPVREFFGRLALKPPLKRLYSCAVAGTMGDEVETIRRLAVEQWVSPVAFRSTVEAMHDDGVRLFVEVGARGSLTGYVEDSLRGRPHFAVAANLPRRSGLSQLNHLVAALYAQGVDLQPGVLYARRRPLRVDLSKDLPDPAPVQALAVGFPEMRLSSELVEGLRSRPSHVTPARSLNGRISPEAADHRSADRDAGRSAHGGLNGNGHARNGSPPVEPSRAHSAPAVTTNGDGRHEAAAPSIAPGGTTTDAAMLSFFETMDGFLESQSAVMQAYLAGSGLSTPTVIGKDVNAEALVEGLDEHVSIPTRNDPVPVAERPVEDDRALVPDVADLLLEQVSKRTGYPREMLALDLDMEADLGIDSIKRVEILGALQERGVFPEGVDRERLSRCRTLGQVAALLKKTAPATPQWVGEIETFTPGKEVVALRRLDAATDPVAAQHTLGGRRISALEPQRLGLPVIPFTVMAELVAQAAALLVPGKVVIGFRDLQANRWIRYEETAFDLEVRARRDDANPDEVRASIRTRGVVGSAKAGTDAPAVEGVVVFGDRREPGQSVTAFHLPEAAQSRFHGQDVYDDQWLFHGPALQAVTRIGAASRHGIEGTIRVLPRRDLLPETLWPTLHTDPIVLDAFTHLLGCWGLDKQAGQEGDVMFPLRLASLTLHGDDPPEGALVDCRIRVLEISRYRVNVDADLVGPDGRIWIAIRGWEDWRFYWPGRYRDVFRMPDTVFVGEPLDLPDALDLHAVWLEPPADMGKPLWRDVLEWVQLSPDERRALRVFGEAEPAFTLRIWERIAAKEAARRLALARGGLPVYPADLEVSTAADGHSSIRSRLDPGRDEAPTVSFASAEGVAVAVAVPSPMRAGISVERVDAPIGDAPGASCRRWLELNTAPGPLRDEWTLRLRCAGDAASRATGDSESEFAEADPRTGAIVFRRAGTPPKTLRCGTARRGEYVVAWTRMEANDR